NALEFVKGPLALFLADKGIEHQTTCVDRPQQNGIPSSVLQNKTPYEKLLHKVSDYRNLRVFGCFAVATNSSRVVDKFSPRGVPCVFLGYPTHKKGYKLYNLLTHSSFVSRDVVFHEHIFPFNESIFKNFFQPMLVSMHAHTPLVVYNDCEPVLVPNNEVTQEEIVVPNTPNVSSQNLPTSSTTVHTKILVRKSNPKGFKEAVRDAGWCDAMNAELRALEENGENVQDTKSSSSKSKADYSLFTKKNAEGFTAFLVYVDDLMINGNDAEQIANLKRQLNSQFHMKDLGALHYFLGLEVTKAYSGLFVSQKKYSMEMLQEAVVMNSRPYQLLMDPNIKLQADIGTPLPDPKSPTSVHMQAVKHLLRYLLNSPGQDLGLKDLHPVTLHCDNQAAIHIAANPLFHARTKHIKVDCHYVRVRVKEGSVKPTYLHTSKQLADVFTKILTIEQHHKLLSKLGVFTLYTAQVEGKYKDKGG
ncbi:cysteine-rich receptor-like protein kinase 8, partial [Tanacetum coccineum]